MRPIARRLICSTVTLFLCLIASGCASYRTPGAGVDLAGISGDDAQDIGELMRREPASPFPARMALVRAQSPGYATRGGASCHGEGQFCVVASRDVERAADFRRLGQLPLMAAVAPVGRLILPRRLDTVRDDRIAAAALKADLVLVYSLDTRFEVDSTPIGPLALISLGLLPNKQAQVLTTASGALFDVRRGFVYGTVEWTARESQRATFWSTEDAIDSARRKAETDAFQGLVDQFEDLWIEIVSDETDATRPAPPSRRTALRQWPV
jgi:hypothetical protein